MLKQDGCGIKIIGGIPFDKREELRERPEKNPNLSSTDTTFLAEVWQFTEITNRSAGTNDQQKVKDKYTQI